MTFDVNKIREARRDMKRHKTTSKDKYGTKINKEKND